MADPHQVAAILDNSRQELAEAITDRYYQLHPELAERFGPAGRSHCPQDTEYHLSYLSAAVAAGTPAFFTEYVDWCKTMLGARGIGAGDLAENLRILWEVLERSLPPDVCTLAVLPVDAGLAELGRASAAPASLLAADPTRSGPALADEPDQRATETLLHRRNPTDHVPAVPLYLLRGEERPDIGR